MLGCSLLCLLVFTYAVNKSEVFSLLSAKPIAFLHLSKTLVDGFTCLVGIHRCQNIVEGLERFTLSLELRNVAIYLFLVVLLILIDEDRNIMNKEETAFYDIDSLAAKHGNGRYRSIHTKSMSMNVAMVLECLVYL